LAHRGNAGFGRAATKAADLLPCHRQQDQFRAEAGRVGPIEPIIQILSNGGKVI